jgi:Lecithin retinol acyltransferase
MTLPVGNITPVIGDTHVTQCTIFGWPAFLHFGTEIADGAIVENTLRYGYRRLDSHADFTRGRVTWVRPSNATAEERTEAARRAESKVGHRAYNLFWNNCEHFANWCATGLAFSQQVIEVARRVLGAAFMLAGVIPCVDGTHRPERRL